MGCKLGTEAILVVARTIINEFESLSVLGKLFEGLRARNDCPIEDDCNKVKEQMNCQFMRSQRSIHEFVLYSWVFILTLVVVAGLLAKKVHKLNKIVQQASQQSSQHTAQQAAQGVNSENSQCVKMDFQGYGPQAVRMYSPRGFLRPLPPPKPRLLDSRLKRAYGQTPACSTNEEAPVRSTSFA